MKVSSLGKISAPLRLCHYRTYCSKLYMCIMQAAEGYIVFYKLKIKAQKFDLVLLYTMLIKLIPIMLFLSIDHVVSRPVFCFACRTAMFVTLPSSLQCMLHCGSVLHSKRARQLFFPWTFNKTVTGQGAPAVNVKHTEKRARAFKHSSSALGRWVFWSRLLHCARSFKRPIIICV